MAPVSLFVAYTVCAVVVLCSQPPEGSFQKVLQEVDTSLRHYPSHHRVPEFMRDLYMLMKEDPEDILSSNSRKNPYKHSPVIKSFRARARHGRKFKFKIPNISNASDIMSAQLMVPLSINSTIRASYRNRYLSGSVSVLSDLYYGFNATDAVLGHEYINSSSISFHLFNAERISKDEVYLIVYEHISAESIHHTRYKRNFRTSHLRFFQRVVSNVTSGVNEEDCQRVEWTLDFESLGWFWIMEPLTVQVGLCSGSCGLLTSNPNITNHAMIRTLYSIQMDDATEVHSAVCTPTELAPFMLLYFDSNFNTHVRLLPEFIVTACGCR